MLAFCPKIGYNNPIILRQKVTQMSVLTKKAIKESFRELIEKQPIDQITVRDITDNCGISRNTFYYHYADMPTLVEEIVMDLAEEIIRSYPDIKSLEQALSVGAEFILQNRRSAIHILNSSQRYIYERCLMKVCRHVVATYIDVAIPARMLNEQERELMIDFYKCMSFGIIVNWCDDGMKENYTNSFKTLLDVRRRILNSNLDF